MTPPTESLSIKSFSNLWSYFPLISIIKTPYEDFSGFIIDTVRDLDLEPYFDITIIFLVKVSIAYQVTLKLPCYWQITVYNYSNRILEEIMKI